MNTIYNFKDIRRLEESTIANELNDGIIITATSALAVAMSDYYPDMTIMDAHHLIRCMIDEWDKVMKDVNKYLAVRTAIYEVNIEKENGIEDERKKYISLERNASNIWNAIQLLIEADVYPEDIPDDVTRPLKDFKDIWTRLEVNEVSIMKLRSMMQYHLADKRRVKDGVIAALGGAPDEIDGKNRRFYLIGFYFITPLQERIFDILRAAGYELVFLNCYDERYKEAGAIWKKSFTHEEVENAMDIQPDITYDNIFGEIISGKRVDKIDIDIKKYPSNLSFARSLKEPIRAGAQIFAPDPKACEEILKEFYPESFKKKNLLSYPVGQYIYYLHCMWNPVKNDPEIRFDYVYKCFSTGWVISDGENGKNHLRALKRLEIFFADVTDKDKWSEQLDVLKEQRASFPKKEIPEGKDKRWHEHLGSPYKMMSVYNVEENELDIIANLIQKIIHDAEYLFQDRGIVQISSHFDKIRHIINTRMEQAALSKEEQELANQMIQELAEASETDIGCPINAVRDAVLLLVSDNVNKSETFDEETASIDNVILPFSMAESALLSNYGQDIYLVMADEFTLPGRMRELPWPLSEDLIDRLDEIDRDDTKHYVSLMRSIIENRPLSYRYLFYSLMSLLNSKKRPRIHISWITKQGSKTINASPYVLMLDNKANELKEYSAVDDLESLIAEKEVDFISNKVKEPSHDHPIDAWYDYNLCKNRYLYSYLLNEHPEYTDPFHYSFVLTGLHRAYRADGIVPADQITKVVEEKFPFFRNFQKRQSKDFVGNTMEATNEPYDGIDYSSSRFHIHFPVPTQRDKILSSIKRRSDNTYQCWEIRSIEQQERCKYCPYKHLCPDYRM